MNPSAAPSRGSIATDARNWALCASVHIPDARSNPLDRTRVGILAKELFRAVLAGKLFEHKEMMRVSVLR